MRWTSGTRVLQDAVPRIAIALFSAIPAAAPAASVCFASGHGGDKRRSDTPYPGDRQQGGTLFLFEIGMFLSRVVIRRGGRLATEALKFLMVEIEHPLFDHGARFPVEWVGDVTELAVLASAAWHRNEQTLVALDDL